MCDSNDKFATLLFEYFADLAGVLAKVDVYELAFELRNHPSIEVRSSQPQKANFNVLMSHYVIIQPIS